MINTINHIIGTAMVKMNHKVSGRRKDRPVKTVANTAATNVARWFFTYPIDEQAKFPKYNVNGRFSNI